jgi:hypothetical protein
MKDREKPQIQINYWLVPVIGILVFLASGAGFAIFMTHLANAYGLFQGDYFRFGHFQLFLQGGGGGLLAIALVAISGTLAAITTTTALSWGPKAFSILNKNRDET